MKRYGKLIIIVTLVILSFGIYYIQPIFAAETRPEFIIKAKKGDKTLIDNISVEGYYQASNFYGMGTETEITKDGTTYYPTQSYLSQLQGSVSDNEKMTQLQKDYRSFMRGKEPSLVNFFEDDSILAYVEITTDYLSAVTENSEFLIEVLDKKTNDVLSFSIEFPKAADYYSIYVEDVQVANNKLIVVTNGYSITSESGPDEQHLYSIDLPNEKIEKDEKIQFDLIDAKDKQIQYVELLNAGNNIDSSEFLVYQVILGSAQIEEMDDETEMLTLPVFGLVGVNIETGEQFLIDVSDEVGNQALGNRIPIENSTLYFYKENETTLSIYSYSLEQKELVEVESVELTAEQLATLKTDVVVQVNKGIVFFVESSKVTDKKAMRIMAIDSNTGELVVEGVIDEKDNQPVKRDELYLSEVLFQ